MLTFYVSENNINFSPSPIFNDDETALFNEWLPDKTMTVKNEICHGNRRRKERIAILVAVNMSGTEKVKPLLVGKPKKPGCFADYKSLLLYHAASKKAWMIAELFADWLVKVDEKKNIIFFC